MPVSFSDSAHGLLLFALSLDRSFKSFDPYVDRLMLINDLFLDAWWLSCKDLMISAMFSLAAQFLSSCSRRRYSHWLFQSPFAVRS